jgi:hypothetical protein
VGLVLQGWVFRFPISLKLIRYALYECHCIILARPREEVQAEEGVALYRRDAFAVFLRGLSMEAAAALRVDP